MRMTPDQINAAVRISWCHLTPEVDWQGLAERIRMIT
jgi:cysteine desulfurase